MKIAVHAAVAVTTALAIIGVVACGTEPSQTSSSSSAKSLLISGGETSEAPPSTSCTEAEALALLRLQHLRALHLAFALRDRLDDPQLRAFGDRMVEDHMNLVHEIDNVVEGSSVQTDAGGISSSRDMQSLGELTDHAVKEIEQAKPSDVEKVYVHYQVAEHMHAIGLIDNIIAPRVRARADLVQHGRDLFAKHVRHLYEREASLDGMCHAEHAADGEHGGHGSTVR
jgi:predicted outer membrane protein